MSLATLNVRTAFRQGRMDAVVSLANESLAKDSDDGWLWELLGLAEHLRGNPPQSIDALEHASLLVPLSGPARVYLAQGYGRIGKRQLSRDLLTELLADETLTNHALLLLAAALDAVDLPALAMKACRRVASRDPDIAQTYYDMGYYAARCGYPTEVSESLARRAISLDPGSARFRVGLASMLLRLERRAEALELVERFSSSQIADVSCRCCLQRLVALFESAGDYERMQLCEQRYHASSLSRSECD